MTAAHRDQQVDRQAGGDAHQHRLWLARQQRAAVLQGARRLLRLHGKHHRIKAAVAVDGLGIGVDLHAEPVVQPLLPALRAAQRRLAAQYLEQAPALAGTRDVTVIGSGQSGAEVVHRIGPNDGYFAELSRRWSEVINEACRAVPRVPFGPPA